MTPALNGSSALLRFERDNEVEIYTQRNNVRFLPGTATYVQPLERASGIHAFRAQLHASNHGYFSCMVLSIVIIHVVVMIWLNIQNMVLPNMCYNRLCARRKKRFSSNAMIGKVAFPEMSLSVT